MISIGDSITAECGKTYIQNTDKLSKNETYPDSTIFGIRIDTAIDNEKTVKLISMNLNCHNLALNLRYNTDKLLNSVTKDNVNRVMKYYTNDYGKSFVKDVCKRGPFLRNCKKKFYLIHIKECYSERAKELNLDVSNLEQDFENTLQNSFKGFWVKVLGILKKENIEQLEYIVNSYANKIEQKEIEIREERFHKPFTDEQVKTAFNKVQNDYFISQLYDPSYDTYCKDTILQKGVPFNGKVDHPSEQISGTCVMHASVNALIQNEKGAHLVNRLLKFDKDGNSLKVCLPEAALANYYDEASHYIRMTDKNLAVEISFGDGDLAALIDDNINYSEKNHKNTTKLQRGFEVLSGEKAQVYFPDEPIPKGVGMVWEEKCSLNVLYENLKTMLDEKNGAAICSLTGEEMGNYITDLKTETDTGEQAYASDEHAYSIVKITDDSVYLQESNEPTLYIKLDKDKFLNRLCSVATWRY